MTPIPTVWWLRPVSKAALVGAHKAVVWKRLYRRPFPASRSAVGVAHGPPNALDAPKPTSSSRTTSTFGAPSGGRSGSIGGNAAAGSLASSGSVPSYGLSGIGSTSRALLSATLNSSLNARIGSGTRGPRRACPADHAPSWLGDALPASSASDDAPPASDDTRK